MKVELSSADKRLVSLYDSVPTGAFARSENGDLFFYTTSWLFVGKDAAGRAVIRTVTDRETKVEILPKGTRITLISEV